MKDIVDAFLALMIYMAAAAFFRGLYWYWKNAEDE